MAQDGPGTGAPNAMAAGVPAEAGAAKPTGWIALAGLTPRFAVNLGLLLALVVGVRAWAWYCMNWSAGQLEIVGGGIVSVVSAVLIKVLDDRQRQALKRTGLLMLGDRLGTEMLTTLLAVAVVSASFLGTIEVVSPIAGTVQGRLVSAGERTPRPLADGAARFVFATTLWSPAQVRVQVSGYPDRLVPVRALVPTPLSIPRSFVRPIVLLRPNKRLFVDIDSNPMMLKVTIIPDRGPTIERSLRDFHGQPVLIGCGADVDISAGTRASLERDFPNLPRMLRPVSLEGDRFEISAGDQVDVKVLFDEAMIVDNNTPYAQRRFRVKAPSGDEVPSQEEVLFVDAMEYRDLPPSEVHVR
jgi:hypothetical protein